MPTPKFKPGESGNPKGRTPGNPSAALLRKAIVQEIPEIIKVLIEQAKLGDVQAAKCLLDKVCPALKPQAEPICLPVKGTLSDQGGAVIAATMTGAIPPDIGSQLITALANQSKTIEIDEILKRVEALENR